MPYLYSFRRCPYAMRARMALIFCGIQCEVREILLSKKPDALLKVSPKATVPVLVLDDGTILDESLDIMNWAFSNRADLSFHFELSDHADKILLDLDSSFKKNLDAYKYQRGRLGLQDLESLQSCLFSLKKWDSFLSCHSYLLKEVITQVDFAIFPFVRQFAKVDEWFFESSALPHLKSWYHHIHKSELFQKAMPKYPLWSANRCSKTWLLEMF